MEILQVYTMEIMIDPETPETIDQALNCEDKHNPNLTSFGFLHQRLGVVATQRRYKP